MQTPEVSCALSTQSGATTVSFPTEQCLNSGFATVQAPEVSSVFNTQSGATTVSFPTEQHLNSSFATTHAPKVSSVFNTQYLRQHWRPCGIRPSITQLMYWPLQVIPRPKW